MIPVATVSIFEYLIAADGLMNLEYRFDKLVAFCRRSTAYIRDRWGIPEPFNFGVFGILSFIAVVLFQKIVSKFMGRKPGASTQGSTDKYRFNTPNLSEVSMIADDIKLINQDL